MAEIKNFKIIISLKSLRTLQNNPNYKSKNLLNLIKRSQNNNPCKPHNPNGRKNLYNPDNSNNLILFLSTFLCHVRK